MIAKLHYISKGNSIRQQLEDLQNACSSGIELVQLDFSKIKKKELSKLASEAREITAHFQTRLMLTDHYKLAREIKADGVFATSSGPCPMEIRKHCYTWQIIGGAAHTLQDGETLLEKQVDYITLGPFRNEMMPDAALGINGLMLLTEALDTQTPMLATGGITTEDVTAILGTGISGIAVSKAIADDFNSIKTFHELLGASSTEEQKHSFK